MIDTLDLTGLWRLQPDVCNEGEKAGYPEPSFSVRLWREAALPATFERCLPGLASYEEAVWFRREFDVPEDWRDQRVVFQCEGANYHTAVWIDGRKVGENEDGFLPFEFEVHQALQYGHTNTIAVRVDNVRRQGDVPGRQRGWRPYGGLLRELRLVAGNWLHLGRTRVSAEPTADGGRVQVEVEAVNERRGTAPVYAVVTLPGARVVTTHEAIAAGAADWLRVTAEVPGLAPWSPGDPALQEAVIDLKVGEEIVDSRRVRFGVRRVEAKDGLLLLNGEPIRLKGFNRHEDSPRTDMAMDPELARRDLRQMKELGANFVRLCHYPHHPRELDLCDEIGLLVMGEIPLYWWDGLEEGEDQCRRTLEAAKRQLAVMIDRDRNHPSVILWSVSNETQEARPEVAAGNAELVRLAKALDPARLATHVSDKWRDTPSFRDDDVVCVNSYPSWSGRIWRQNHRYDVDDSRRWWEDALAELHGRYPRKPILVTEFGYPCLDGVLDSALGEDMQARVLRAEYAGMQAPYVCGATIWCWADHPWPEEDFIKYMATSPFGVVTRTRRRKQAVATVRELFSDPDRARERSEHDPDNVPVVMIRPDLARIPHFDLPEGYSIRAMRPGESAVWTDVQRESEQFFTVQDHLFESEFGDDLPGTQRRCYLIINERGAAVGTISAWYSRDFRGQDYGRLHWFAIRPGYRSLGLARPAITYCLERMAEWHARAWLATSTGRIPAIKLYLDFGFRPDLSEPAAREAWARVQVKLNHPALRKALSEKQPTR